MLRLVTDTPRNLDGPLTGSRSELRKDDPEAIDRLIRRVEPKLLAAARAGLSQGLRAKVRPSDIVQATLLEAVRDLERFRGQSPVEFEGWLFSILHHTLKDQGKYFAAERRAPGQEQRLSPSSAERLTGLAATPSQIAVTHESEALHATALAGLGDDHRQVLHLREIEQLDFRTIGERLGRSEGAARILHLRARESLARRVRELRPGALPPR